ncbi:MAG TPA: DUF1697 domain-containing protein [Solirubrobacteraceae bacterium]|nr:DUF1697 domain-containing protein [Solirubrobacteraceae bacterium]
MTSLPTQIVLMRGVNLGAANRIAMPALREGLAAAGFDNVRTHLQSGNVLAEGEPEALIAAIRAIIDVPCVARSMAELDAVIAANPFPEEAEADPKLLQVTFWAEPTDPRELDRLSACRRGEERVVVGTREIYSWHPHGIARSKLAQAVVPRGTAATARNWNTLLALQELTHA